MFFGFACPVGMIFVACVLSDIFLISLDYYENLMKKNYLAYISFLFLLWGSISSPTVFAGKDYTETEVTNGGSAVGSVKYMGDLTTLTLQLHGGWDISDASKSIPEKLIVSKINNGLKFAVVSIKNISTGKKRILPTIHPVIDQQRNTFIPHVLAIVAGTTVDILNGDEELHTIHTRSKKNQPFNLGTTYKQRILETFYYPETIKLTCDIHKSAYAWIVVLDNPYFDTTDKNGYFEMCDIPPGTYTFQVWHEELGTLEKEVKINPGEITNMEFIYSQN
jgi:plastocyanin